MSPPSVPSAAIPTLLGGLRGRFVLQADVAIVAEVFEGGKDVR